MSWADQEIQKRIYSILSGDSTLVSLLGGTAKIYDRIPDNAALPFINIGQNELVDRGSHTTEGWTSKLTIHVWTENLGRKSCQSIQARIDFLLHNIDLSVSGWNTLTMRRESVNIVVEPDNATYHGIQTYNLLIGEQ